MFYDEVGLSFLEPLGHTWAPKGKRPVLRRVTRDRQVLSTAVGLTLSGKVYKRHLDGPMDSEDVIEALAHLQRHIPGKFILIWDRANIHTTRQPKAYLPDLLLSFVHAAGLSVRQLWLT